MSDRHADLDWHAQHAAPAPRPAWQHGAPQRTPRRTRGIRRTLAALAVALVAAGAWLVLHAGAAGLCS